MNFNSINRRTLTSEEFQQKLEEAAPGQYTLLSAYEASRIKVLIKHNPCGYTWWITPNTLLWKIKHKSTPPCPHCNNKEAQLAKNSRTFSPSKKQIYQFLKEKYPNEDFEIKSHNKTKVTIRCKVCGHESSYADYRYTEGKGLCQYCYSQTRKITLEETMIGINKEEDYFFLGIGDFNDFSYTFTKFPVEHRKCGRIFYTTGERFLSLGHRCPFCARSKGEDKIFELLQEANEEFIQQYSPDDLGRQAFDFYLPKKNLLIEFDGEFHYIPVFSQADLDAQQQRDKNKNKWAKQHGIQLLRIPFWEFDKLIPKFWEIPHRFSSFKSFSSSEKGKKYLATRYPSLFSKEN